MVVKSRSWMAASWFSLISRTSLRSMPPQKTAPLAFSTMAPTERSESAWSKAAVSSRQRFRLRALRFSGRFSVIVSTRPCWFSSINFHLHAQKRGAIRLTLRIDAQRYCAATTQCFVEQQINCAEVGQLEALDAAFHEIPEELLDPLRR